MKPSLLLQAWIGTGLGLAAAWMTVMWTYYGITDGWFDYIYILLSLSMVSTFGAGAISWLYWQRYLRSIVARSKITTCYLNIGGALTTGVVAAALSFNHHWVNLEHPHVLRIFVVGLFWVFSLLNLFSACLALKFTLFVEDYRAKHNNDDLIELLKKARERINADT